MISEEALYKAVIRKMDHKCCTILRRQRIADGESSSPGQARRPMHRAFSTRNRRMVAEALC